MRVEKLRVNVAFKKNLFFTLVALIFLFQAYFHDKNIVYIFLFFLMGIVVVNNIFLKKNLKGLDFELMGVQNRFAKEESLIWLRVKNDTTLDRYDIWLDSQLSFDILAESQKDIWLKKVFQKRGRVEGIKVRVSSTFPLNMFDKYYSILEFKRKFIIYPAKRGRSLIDSFGDSLSPFGLREDFRGVREYQNSDKASLIHWKSLAKGQIKTKEFEHKHQFDGFVFDLEKIEGDLESRLSQITLWVVEADRENFEFLVKLGREQLSSKDFSRDEILEQLALYEN